MDKDILTQELQFKAVRSSGPGGQHVNKVSSKVVLTFDIINSKGLSLLEKERVCLKLSQKISKDKLLHLQCTDTRSQHKNKELVIDRFFDLIQKALQVSKKRRRTKPPRSAIAKRLRTKKRAAEKKANRRRPEY